MRRTVFLAATLFAASAPAPAHAATTTSSVRFELRTSGVTVTREASGAYRVTLDAHAFRPLAGRHVIITCESAAHRLPPAAFPRPYETQILAPRSPKPFRVRPAPGVDLCFLATQNTTSPVAVALSPRARRLIAETQAGLRLGVGVGVLTVAASSQTSWPAASELPRRARTVLAGLHYATDGRRRMSLTAPVAGGGEVFVRADGDVLTTNLGGIASPVLSPDTSVAAQLPAGAFPPAGTLPASTVPGVSATFDGSRVSIAFDGSSTATNAYGRLAGRQLDASCSPEPDRVLGLVAGRSAETAFIRAPAQPATLSFRMHSHAPAVCSLSLGRGTDPVVRVALGSTGPALLEEGLDGLALQAVAARAAGGGLSTYATAPSLEQTLAGGVVALASPGDTPGDRRIGVYSPGSRRLTVVAQTLTGRRLFADFDGDVVTTNLGSVIDLLGLF